MTELHAHETAERAPAPRAFDLVARTPSARISSGVMATDDAGGMLVRLVRVEATQGDIFAAGGASVTFPAGEADVVARAIIEAAGAKAIITSPAGAGAGVPRPAPARPSSAERELTAIFDRVVAESVRVERKMIAADLQGIQFGVLAGMSDDAKPSAVLAALRDALRPIVDRLGRGDR